MLIETINKFHMEDIKSTLHPSIFFREEKYDLLIIRLPLYDKTEGTSVKSLAFVITDTNYFYYDKIKNDFMTLDKMKNFHQTLDKYVDNVLEVIAYHTKNIEQAEDNIYEGKSLKGFNKICFHQKIELIRISRVLQKAQQTLEEFMLAYKDKKDYLPVDFEDTLEHLQRSLRNSEYLLEKLDSMYNFNLNKTNEQMNKIIYILTILSGFFLPLNLIVGFFGMNTTSLPFTVQSGGTMSVISVLLGVSFFSLFLMIYFRKRY